MKSMNTHLSMIIAIGLSSGCTGQVAGSFRFQQQNESFRSEQEVNTKIDLLWVVDNSSSMDVSQAKLRAGFESFASRYMKPTWDIRVAAISTDTYIANSAFNAYLSSTVPGTAGYVSPYLGSLPAQGLQYADINPLWGSQYARLLAGIHDGPLTALCFEGMPYFFLGVTNCRLRDAPDSPTGTANCLNPGAGESSLSQCVNTVANDTVRSGKAIISTLGAQVDQLNRDFMINLSTGSSGHGSERGLGSVLQLISDNETTATSFFRQGSLRVLIFVTDEDDQTMRLPSSVPPGFEPFSNYACDQTSIIAANGSASGQSGGYCCASGCLFGASGTNCPSKTVDGLTYRLGICPVGTLVPVAEVKQTLDAFFRALDSSAPDADPNYFVASIVPTTAQAIQQLQTSRTDSDFAVGVVRTWAVDRPDRYLELGALVGSDSLALDISAHDYTPILDSIGRKIIEKKSTFILNFAPTGTDDMVITIRHINGTETPVPAGAIQIEGKILRITDLDLVLSFSSTDQIVINYQPKSNL